MIMNCSNEYIINLGVIAQLKVGQKLNCAYQYFSIDDATSWWNVPTSIIRFMRSDSRNVTILRVSTLVDSVIKLISYHAGDKLICRNFALQLHLAGIGLRNLKTTYSKDKLQVAQLDLIIRTIDKCSIDHEIPTLIKQIENHEATDIHVDAQTSVMYTSAVDTHGKDVVLG